MFDKQNFFTFAAFPSTSKENISKEMQNIRPNLLDPMSLHVSYTGSGMGLITPPYSRMDMNGEVDIYDRKGH
jgi:hypothetical protein